MLLLRKVCLYSLVLISQNHGIILFIWKGPQGCVAPAKSLSISCSFSLTVCSCSAPPQPLCLPTAPHSVHISCQKDNATVLCPNPAAATGHCWLPETGMVASSTRTLLGLRPPISQGPCFLPGRRPCPMVPHHHLGFMYLERFWF